MHKNIINGLIYIGAGIVTVIATVIMRANDKPTIVKPPGPNIEVIEIEIPTPTQEPETTPAETAPEVEETTTQEAIIPVLDSVPFDSELQEWIYTYSCDRGVSPYLVYAVCWRESRYTIDITGDNGQSHGLMQIKVMYHYERLNRLGVSDLYDARQNIMVGVDYLLELLNYREDTTLEWALMAYNGGPDYADEMQRNGKVSEYALEVIKKLGELNQEGDAQYETNAQL